MLSLCTCCRKSPSKSEDGDVYGVVNPSVPVATDAVDGGGPVQFRNGYAKKNHDRSSLPSHSNGNGTVHTRVSAPGRALPQLPAGDLYSAIDKSRKDSIRFVDDLGNPTYESIDPDADSFVDPLYSKVGDPVSSRKDRKYDYPVFSGRHNDPGPSTRAPDETYQSASQIYGSEDPYRRGRAPVVRFQRSARVYRIPISPPRVSVAGYYYRSITSSARVPGDEYGDEDNSSAYDPGYAKVQSLADPRNSRLERKERELDQLYSKISRNPRDPDEQPGPRAMVDLPPNQPELPILAMFNPGVPPVVDNPSVESREPSYRYITVRENADRVRERLRQQGQLDLPRREHYYSTIGNEYDTIQAGSSTYGQVQEPVPVQNSLAIHTDQSSSYAPPPPTSPIPHRLDYTDPQLSEQLPQYATVNKKRNSTPGSTSYQSGWNPMTLSTATSFAGLTRSFTGTSSHPFGQMSPVASSSTSIQGIKEFMQKPLLPYGTTETVLGRKVVEERERIVEKRMSTGDPSTSQERVHHVEITRSDGPSADTIISGRRYRGSSAVSHEDPPSSARSNLPIPVNRAETSRLSDLAHQRKQRSLDSDNRNDQKSSKKRPEKNFLSSIYTANDYISPIDLTNGSERPWPISRDASPSSKRP